MLAVLALGLLAGCRKSPEQYSQRTDNPEYLRQAERKLTDVIVHDVFGPPVAARIYTYASLAAYEALLPAYPQYRSMARQLRGYTATPPPQAGAEYSFPLAALRAYLALGRQWTFSGDLIDDFEQDFYKQFENELPADVYERSMAYGDTVARHVIAYSQQDQYRQTRGYKYTLKNRPGAWVPTPPAYMDGLEPLWNRIRPMTLDTAAQFMPLPPPAFSLRKDSPFYREVMQVYEAVRKARPEEVEIANFWDCNPFKINVQGHASYATKKISPGGHWMRIAGLVSRQAGQDVMQTAETYLLTSVAIFDGFISCWDEKYRSIRVRPETFINEHLDSKWEPLLQTPPFPEYTSGHSVVSAASAEVLSKVIGESFAFTDSTEVAYGLPVRRFASFRKAAQEAAISRFYGGIHYRSAVEEGYKEGTAVGQWVLARLQTRNAPEKQQTKH